MFMYEDWAICNVNSTKAQTHFTKKDNEKYMYILPSVLRGSIYKIPILWFISEMCYGTLNSEVRGFLENLYVWYLNAWFLWNIAYYPIRLLSYNLIRMTLHICNFSFTNNHILFLNLLCSTHCNELTRVKQQKFRLITLWNNILFMRH